MDGTKAKPFLFGREVAEYLSAQRVARLATVDAEGRPYVVPVCYAFDGGDFYVALDDKPKNVPPTRLKRVRNILANPHVSLLADGYSEDWSRLRYVMVEGEAGLVEPGTEPHHRAIEMLRDKYPQYRSMAIDERPAIAVSPVSCYEWRAGGESGLPPSREVYDFAALVQGRHVVRQYEQVAVPRELIEQALEAARWAPSPHGAQPWRFAVITRRELKEKLAGEMAGEWRRNLEMDGEGAEAVEARLEKSKRRILGSPVLIVPCLYLEDLQRYPDPDRQAAETTMAIQSLGAAVQNLMLSAYSLGLDTGWMCAPLFAPEVVRHALDLPATLVPHALIQMGWGAKDPPRRPHRPVDTLVALWD